MIPTQLTDYPLIRVCRPNCQSHSSSCSGGKRPVTSVDDNTSIDRIKSWINRGGNYGIVARSDNDLIIFDSDSSEFSDVLKTKLPPTFTVVSGGQGWGEHLYYRCSDADIQSKWSDPEGSVRVKNWHCVGPGSEHSETGEMYEVKSDEPIAEVSIDDLRAAISELDTRSNRQPTRSGGGGDGSSGDPPAAARVGSSSEYPSREVSVDIAYNWVTGNDLDDRFARTDKSENGDESADDFVLCKCMAEAGIAAETIIETMNQHRTSGSKWHYRDRDYRLETVQNAINEAVKDSYVDFSDTADMGSGEPERRKTEEFGGSRTQQGGEQTMSQTEYSQTETVTNTESDDPEDGERVVRAMVTRASDDEESYEFAQILTGTIETDETFGASPDWQTDGSGQNKTRTIGSTDPEYLRLVAESLNDLADEIED